MKLSPAHGKKFVEHVVPAVIRPLRVLWNQVIGFFFLVLALWATPRGVKSVREFDGGAESLFRLVLTLVFILTMAICGIYSFLRARKAAKT